MCVCVCMLGTQSCPTLCDPMDWGSMPGSSVHRILQVRLLEWLPSSPENLPYPGIEPGSPKLQAESLPSEPQYIDIYNLINFKISTYLEPNALLGNRNTKQDMISLFSH